MFSCPPSKLLLISFSSNPALQGICNLQFVVMHSVYHHLAVDKNTEWKRAASLSLPIWQWLTNSPCDESRFSTPFAHTWGWLQLDHVAKACLWECHVRWLSVMYITFPSATRLVTLSEKDTRLIWCKFLAKQNYLGFLLDPFVTLWAHVDWLFPCFAGLPVSLFWHSNLLLCIKFAFCRPLLSSTQYRK